MTGREASIAARLKKIALVRGFSFQYATLLYMHEGLLRRLSCSEYCQHFTLKGGLLLQCLSTFGGRVTKDMDFLGIGIDNDLERLRFIFQGIVGIVLDDGLRFDLNTISLEAIVEGAEYHGVRIRMKCFLGNIRNGIQIDVGFGDAVDPPPRKMMYPSMLDDAGFTIMAYPLAVVIAEKFEAMVSRAEYNSRMKDYWDISFILKNFDVSQIELQSAFKATFKQRSTALPDRPLVLRREFEDSVQAGTMWTAFIRRIHLPDISWSETLSAIRNPLSGIYDEMIREIRHRI